MKYRVYILLSLKNNSFYIGVTNNLTRRINQHNRGKSKSTKSGIPWKLVYYEEFDNIKEAYKREGYIKSLKKRKFIEKLILSPRSSTDRTLAF